jgi:hypothetical protein
MTARLGNAGVIASAPLATLYLSFSNGGFFPNAVGVVGLCLCALLVLRTTLAERPFDGCNRRVAVAVVAFSLLALLQLGSALWSHTAFRALDGFNRTFMYVLVLALFGSLPRTNDRLRWLTRSLAASMSAVVIVGLVSRVLPHLWPTAAGFSSSRLSYPLGYWNALGVMGALASILLLHLTSSLREPRWIRVLAAALFPAVAAGTLLTYSRGALAVAVLGLVLYAVLGRPRGLLSGVASVALPTAVAVKAGYDAVLLSTSEPTSAAAVAQGHHVAGRVGLAILAAAILRTVALLLDDWLRESHPAPEVIARIPRRPALGAGVVIALIVLLVVGGAGFVSRQYKRFVGDTGPRVALTRDRLTDPAGNGRVALWHTGIQQFDRHPLVGGGAGTYQTYYAQHRTTTDTVIDTHSLYVQTMGEDGLVGIILLAVVLVAVLAVFAARARGPTRSMYAALLAAGVAWAIHGAFDWDWQMPAVTLWFFAAGGMALASRPSPERSFPVAPNRTALAASFLALAVAPLLIGFSYQRLRAASSDLVAGNCSAARQQALGSISLLAVRPQAYEILGYCDLEQGFPIEALAAMRKAVSYDKQDWNGTYGLAIALAANGLDPLPAVLRTIALDPLNPLGHEELRLFESAGPLNWPQAASGLVVGALRSDALEVSNL